ncbi:MAG: hypothetical protein ACLFP8_05780 [Alphaproteobacteria bacterium]
MTDNTNNTEPQNTPAPQQEEQILIAKYNLLKNKAGIRTNMKENGFIEENKIKEADALIARLCTGSDQKIKEQIQKLTELWKNIQDMPAGDARKKKTKEIFTIAHEIKDISALCGFTLVAYFAESLRDYIAETTMNLKSQKIIIQAHIDAMSTILKTKISDEENPIALELKNKVKIAIEKYQ